jgi:hypothetical protein
MTITEQLQFSVLSAPVAALDRRALSQAWYSALFETSDGKSAAAQPRAQLQAAPAPGARARAAEELSRVDAPVRRQTARGSGRESAPRCESAPIERRGPRSGLARKIERAFLQPQSASRKSAFTIEGQHGRVRVLLQTRGSQLKLVAICAPTARAYVAAALAQARYALALRGIDLCAETREAQAC